MRSVDLLGVVRRSRGRVADVRRQKNATEHAAFRAEISVLLVRYFTRAVVLSALQTGYAGASDYATGAVVYKSSVRECERVGI